MTRKQRKQYLAKQQDEEMLEDLQAQYDVHRGKQFNTAMKTQLLAQLNAIDLNGGYLKR